MKIHGINPAVCAMLERRGYHDPFDLAFSVYLRNPKDNGITEVNKAIIECLRLTRKEKRQRYRMTHPSKNARLNRRHQATSREKRKI